MKELLIDSVKKILIISPHPDDESIGCGALLSKYGKQCDVIILTDGCCGNPEWSQSRTSRIRRREAIKTMEMANVNSFTFLNIRDNTLAKHLDCLYGINLEPYDYVFVPGKYDEHPDHKAAYKCLIRALKYKKINKKVCQYEVWTPLIKCTNYLSFKSSDKSLLIKNYVCQLKHIDYLAMANGLGMYRAAQLHLQKDELAEIFFVSEEGYMEKRLKYFW